MECTKLSYFQLFGEREGKLCSHVVLCSGVSGACFLGLIDRNTHTQTPWALERGGSNLTLDTLLNLAE